MFSRQGGYVSAETQAPFDELLKDYRRAAGLTQAALAERAGVSVRGIQALERGDNRPQRDTVRRLAVALGLREEERARFVAVASPGPRQRTPSGSAPSPSSSPSAPVPANAGARGSATAAGGGTLVPFVGRVHVLELLERHLDGDGPPLLLLAGEPGIGKTRLLQEAAGRAVARGLTVLVGGCHRRGGQEPYAPLLGALERHIGGQTPLQRRAALQDCAWLVRLLPERAADLPSLGASTALPPEQERRLMFRAVGRYLANVAGPAGTLLVLDDLQWAGADALDLLMTLVRAAPETPLRVLGAYRDSEMGPHDPLTVLLVDLVHAGLAAHHPLGPLAPVEAAQLLSGLLPDGEGVGQVEKEHILQQAGGVPFFLVSYAQELRSRPAVAAHNGVPWGLQQSVRQRVAALPEAVRGVLGLAAVMGRQVRADVLCQTAGVSDEMVYAALEEACRTRLLVEEEQGYRFAHDVIREVLEADLGAPRRARLHLRIAEALDRLAQEGGQILPVAMLAYHYGHSDAHATAARFLEQAGDHAQEQCAHAAAQAHYQEAADRFERLGRPLDAARALHKLGLALRLEGRRYDAALAALEGAAQTYGAAGDLESLARTAAEIGYAHYGRGTSEEGIRRLEEIRDRIEAQTVMETRRPGLAMLHAALAQLYLYAYRYPEHVAAVERTMALARDAGDDAILAVAELNQGLALLMMGRTAEAATALEQGGRRAEATGQHSARVGTLSTVAAICLLASEPEIAMVHAEQALAAAERVGDAGQLAFIHFLRGEALYYMGPWPEAGAAFERGAALGTQVEATATACYPLLGLGVLAMSRGEADAARPHLEDGLRRAEDAKDSRAVSYLAGALAECDLLSGHAAEAVARLGPLVVQPDRDGTSAFVLTRLAWAHLEVGDLQAAAAAAGEGVANARAAHAPGHLSEALWAQARIEIRRGEWAAAERSVAEALELARSKHYAAGEARALKAYAELHVQRGDLQKARERLEEVRALFHCLDVPAEAARLEQAIAALSQKEAPLATRVTAAQWAQIQALLPPPRQGRGRPRADDRRTLDAILYVQRTGCAWSALPAELGDGATAHRRWQQWRASGVWERMGAILEASAT